MKKLNDLLCQSSEPHFPIIGRNGYGGEMDGSHPVIGTFRVSSRDEAKGILLPDFVKLNWAQYNPGRGWSGAVGYWSDSDINDSDERMLDASCDSIQWD